MSVSAHQAHLFGDMQVERELGEGGMGKVQLVRSRSTGERFAVKRTKFREWAGQRNFLLELQVWYGLPRYPHLVECRFFRTLQDDATGESEIAIFAEYVPAGSLADWIEGRKLSRLDQILDVAIQFAWGLHAAHELRVVHQDVKPGNVLLSSDQIVKVADFGLARARARAGEETSSDSPPNILVSSGGMTRAYCSPEQFAGERLNHKTDIWSWGVSILDMFTGKPNKSIGARAHRVVLKEYLETGADDPLLPPMPAGLVKILSRCFRDDPNERWESMAEIADALRGVYREELGQDYARPGPPRANQVERAPGFNARRMGNVQWNDPLRYLREAWQALWMDPAEIDQFVPPRGNSLRAQAIADLIVYEEARRILEAEVARHLAVPLFRGGHVLAQTVLGDVCLRNAGVHRAVGDPPGATALFDRAIATYGSLIHAGQTELAPVLAEAFDAKAHMLGDLGELRPAVAVYDQAIAIRRPLVDQGQSDLAKPLAFVYQNKGIMLKQLGDVAAALPLFDSALAIYERLLATKGDWEVESELARAHHNKGNALAELNQFHEALADYGRSIESYERLVKEGHAQLRGGLSLVYECKAIALSKLAELSSAMPVYDQALQSLDGSQHGQGVRADSIASIYLNQATALMQQGKALEASPILNSAIEAYKRLVNQEGRSEFNDDLALAYANKAVVATLLGNPRLAVELYDEAIRIRERLVHEEGKKWRAPDLAWTYRCRGNGLADLGELVPALANYGQAIAIYEELVGNGRLELRGDLAWAKALRAQLRHDRGERSEAQREAQVAVPMLAEEAQKTGRADLQQILDRARNGLKDVL